MKGRTQCVVPGCTNFLSGAGNLYGIHRVPGAILRLGECTMINTTRYVEYGDECCLIALNDFALGHTFAGAEGFVAKLQS